MFPDSSGATTPLYTIASRQQDRQQEHEDVDGGTPPSWSSTETASAKSPEPHWDSVISAATD